MQEECPRIVESQWPGKGKIPYLDTFHAFNCKKKEKKRKEKKSKEKKKERMIPIRGISRILAYI